MRKSLKQSLSLLLALLMMLALLAGCNSDNSEPATEPTEAATEPTSPEPTNIRLAALKGPTTMGMAKLLDDNDNGLTQNHYDFTLTGTADEIVSGLIQGNLDAAAVPCNLASVLYNRTEGGVQVAAINTLGVLYVVETGDTIHSVEDLRGKTIYSTGQGTTPEFSLNYILSANGIDPATDVTVEFKSEATEIAALLAGADLGVAVLPQPYVTAAQKQNENLRVALNLSDEWDATEPENGSAMVTGVVLVRKEFAEQNKAAVDAFLNEYQASVAYVNANVDEAAVLVAALDITPEAIGKVAIPLCNIVFIDGDEMQSKVNGYLSVLFEQNPASVGGTLPDESFYYKK